MSYEELGNKFDMEPVTIRVRAHRKKWAVPSRVQRLQKLLRENKLNEQVIPTNPTKEVGNETEGNVALKLAESMVEKGQKGANFVVDGLLGVIERTFNPSSALMNKEITSHKEAGSMFSTFAKASGLDKPQIAIQTNVWQQSDECRDG